jgi:hypothetical protein
MYFVCREIFFAFNIFQMCSTGVHCFVVIICLTSAESSTSTNLIPVSVDFIVYDTLYGSVSGYFHLF